MTLASLQNAIGVVSQDAHLFHDSIRANLLYARPEATEEELWTALEGARIGALVRSLPEGLDTVVGDRGYRMSGGEKQRLAIARVLLKGPGIVILDEATAHLDSESEVAVQHALDTALSGRTSLVIAHRLSTIRSADQIWGDGAASPDRDARRTAGPRRPVSGSYRTVRRQRAAHGGRRLTCAPSSATRSARVRRRTPRGVAGLGSCHGTSRADRFPTAGSNGAGHRTTTALRPAPQRSQTT